MANPTVGGNEVWFLNEATQTIGGAILSYAVALAAVGAIVMALIELVKAIVPIRRFFNKRQTTRWIGADDALQKEFMALTTGGYASLTALFDQPIEKLMAQVQAAANMAMDFPDRYPKFYAFLTRQPDARHPEDAARWQTHVQNAKALAANQAPSDAEREAARARARLQNLVARQLDAFQTETQYRWARDNQIASTAMGTVFILLVLVPARDSLPISPAHIPFLIPFIALLGGMMAPVAKDLVTALSRFAK